MTFLSPRKSIKPFIIFIAILLIYASCRKENSADDDPSIKLSFSTDSIVFDTIFTTVGSVTKYLKVYNRHDKRINISSIRLGNGSSSLYRINVDGQASSQVNNVEIAADDSIFVFVRVTIDPNSTLTPFVVSDQIFFETNTNIQDIDLVSWGQNAYYHIADTKVPGLPEYKIVVPTGSSTTWKNDKPHLVYGYAVVDSLGSLTIEEGTSVHFHNGSGLWIYRFGNIKVMGTRDNPVTFQGDRLENSFKDIPGQWDRIWINEGSTENEINHAIIRNGFIGLQTETFNLQNPVEGHVLLTNTIIENMTGVGILSRFYAITGINNLVDNCGQYGVALTWGGQYDFRQCTFANYWDKSIRQTENLAMNNYYEDNEGNLIVFEMNAFFGNCINYGRLEEEMIFDEETSAPFDYKFENCLLKTTLNISDVTVYPGSIKNQEPKFADVLKFDYHLDTLSPAISTGSLNVINSSAYPGIISTDLDGNSRTDPDIGAYQYTGDR